MASNAAEQQPLLHAQAGSSSEGYQAVDPKRSDLKPGEVVDPEALPDARTPEEKRTSLIRWSLFYLGVAVLVGVLLFFAIKDGKVAIFSYSSKLSSLTSRTGPI